MKTKKVLKKPRLNVKDPVSKTINEFPEKQKEAQEKLKSMTTSPVPTKKVTMLTFTDAIREVLAGKKLTKVSWDDVETYMLLREEFLYIHIGGKFHQLILSTGDMEAIDWYVLP